MREIKADFIDPSSPYEQVVFWRHHKNVALWLLAEKDYLLDLERDLHLRQAQQIKHYRSAYQVTLEWLLAEARWYAQEAEKRRFWDLNVRWVVGINFPWGSMEVRPNDH